MKISRFTTTRVVNIDENFILVLLLAMYKTYISFLELLEDYLLRTWPDHHYQEENQLENKKYSTRNVHISMHTSCTQHNI